MRLTFKLGVMLLAGHLEPEVMAGLDAAMRTAPPLYGNVLVVTSAGEGEHGPKSLHYDGKAWDLRWQGFRQGAIVDVQGEVQRGAASRWVARLQEALGGRWDVVLMPDHIHLELDP